jgi:hypothetical protein
MSTDTSHTWQTSFDELENLEVTLVPNEDPPHPKALTWVEAAYAAQGQHGTLAVIDDAQYERIRGHLRKAARHLGYSVTIKPVKNADNSITGLTFTVGRRRGRKF